MKHLLRVFSPCSSYQIPRQMQAQKAGVDVRCLHGVAVDVHVVGLRNRAESAPGHNKVVGHFLAVAGSLDYKFLLFFAAVEGPEIACVCQRIFGETPRNLTYVSLI